MVNPIYHPKNLFVKIPDNVSTTDASTVALGAIALQGVRRIEPTLGEFIVVIGLGILGQLTVQLLKANGCIVAGIDPDTKRLETALSNGMDFAIKKDIVSTLQKLTDGDGVDGVIITGGNFDIDPGFYGKSNSDSRIIKNAKEFRRFAPK